MKCFHLQELEDVLPLKRLLALVGTYKDNITAAIETLQPTAPWEQQAGHASESGEGATYVEGGRAFGGALEALMDYFGTQAEVQVCNQPSLSYIIPKQFKRLFKHSL
jgi:hypothetical protein